MKLSRKKKINNDEINKADVGKVDELDNEVESGLDEQNGSLLDRQNKERKLRKKRKKSDKKRILEWTKPMSCAMKLKMALKRRMVR